MGWLCTWLETRARWSKLRDLGQSNLVRASVLMPVFGYLLLLNEQVHQYLTIQFDHGWPSSHWPMWRLWMLYYGSFFLAVASILFAWRCPPRIKQYETAFRLVEAERDHLTAHNLHDDEITGKLRTLYAGISKWEDKIFWMTKLNVASPNLGAGRPGISGDVWSLGLIHIWSISNIKQPKLRIFVYLLFRVGLILIAIPAAFTFIQVTKHLLI